jgi:hypothetical protein
MSRKHFDNRLNTQGETKMDSLPKENNVNGSFNGREVYLSLCGCSTLCDRPVSRYMDTHEQCEEQAVDLMLRELGLGEIEERALPFSQDQHSWQELPSSRDSHFPEGLPPVEDMEDFLLFAFDKEAWVKKQLLKRLKQHTAELRMLSIFIGILASLVQAAEMSNKDDEDDFDPSSLFGL